MVSCNSCRVSTTASCANYGQECINVNYQCDSNTNDPYAVHMDGRGVTYWGGYPYCNSNSTNNNSGATHTLSPAGQQGDTWDVQFTCTQPRCYQSQAVCNVFFNAYANSNSQTGFVTVAMYTNDLNKTKPGYMNLSRSGNKGWQAIDLANTQRLIDNGNGTNHYVFVNQDPSISVTIANFQIMRAYTMCTLYCDELSLCNDTTQCNSACKSAASTNNTGDYYGRIDYPCNLDVSAVSGNWGNCGGRSATFYQDPEFSQAIMQPGDCLQWNYDFTPYSQYNYVGPEVCLLNLNGVTSMHGNGSYPNDLPLDLYVNGVLCCTFHISDSQSGGFSPSYNLANCSGYVDNGFNQILLKETVAKLLL